MENNEQNQQSKNSPLERLLPVLPPGEFVMKPQEIDRLTVQLLPGGRIAFNGPRSRIEEFIQACIEEGLEVYVDHITFCG